jgi:hypothetical protein
MKTLSLALVRSRKRVGLFATCLLVFICVAPTLHGSVQSCLEECQTEYNQCMAENAQGWKLLPAWLHCAQMLNLCEQFCYDNGIVIGL